LAVELDLRGIPFHHEAAFALRYKNRPLELRYRVDFVCFDAVVVEVKALRSITTIEEAQALNYLRAAGLDRALILNFGTRSLQYRRLVW
jgi:GxxExxY protein